jgi:hypothetical protein
VYSLVYASEEQHPFSEPELDYLLERSRAWNEGHGLSGLLLYKSGSFMQAIEGDEAAVRKTFKRRITKDRRHAGVRVLSASEVRERQFPRWTMGYSRVPDEANPAVPGYDDFLSRGNLGPSWSSPTPARVLLDWFRLYSDQATHAAPPTQYRIS